MLIPILLDDFLTIARDNDRRIWYYERMDRFELYTVSDGVISYTEMPKEGLNYEKTFFSKPFIGSKKLPASLRIVNNYNTEVFDVMNTTPAVLDSVPKHEEDVRDEEIQVTGATPDVGTDSGQE